MAGGGITTTDTNKTALAIMMVLLLTMGLGVFSNAIYSPDRPGKPGYALPSGEATTAKADAPKEDPLPVLLAKADAGKGEADTKVCQSCHSLRKGRLRQGRPAALRRRRAAERLDSRLRLFRRHEVQGRRLDL